MPRSATAASDFYQSQCQPPHAVHLTPSRDATKSATFNQRRKPRIGRLAWIIQAGCVKLAQVQGVSAQAASDAGDTLPTYESIFGERRRTDAWACSTHPTF